MKNPQWVTVLRVSFFWIWLFGTLPNIEKAFAWHLVFFLAMLGLQIITEAFVAGFVGAMKDWKRTGRIKR